MSVIGECGRIDDMPRDTMIREDCKPLVGGQVLEASVRGAKSRIVGSKSFFRQRTRMVLRGSCSHIVRSGKAMAASNSGLGANQPPSFNRAVKSFSCA